MTLHAINQNVKAPIDTTPTPTSSHVSKSDSSSTSLTTILGNKIRSLFCKSQVQENKDIELRPYPTTTIKVSDKAQISIKETADFKKCQQDINILIRQADNLLKRRNITAIEGYLDELLAESKDMIKNAETVLKETEESELIDKVEIDSLPKEEKLELEQLLEEAIKNDWNLPNDSSWVDTLLTKEEKVELEQVLKELMENDWNLPNNSSWADAFLTKEERLELEPEYGTLESKQN